MGCSFPGGGKGQQDPSERQSQICSVLNTAIYNWIQWPYDTALLSSKNAYIWLYSLLTINLTQFVYLIHSFNYFYIDLFYTIIRYKTVWYLIQYNHAADKKKKKEKRTHYFSISLFTQLNLVKTQQRYLIKFFYIICFLSLQTYNT